MKLAGYVVFAGMNINYILDEINVERDQEFNTSPYIGQEGSRTNFVSSSGRILTFKSLCKRDEPSWHGRGHRINDYIYIAKTYKEKAKVLTSSSKSNLKGNYICTGFSYTEDTNRDYIISWKFQEVIKFNATKKTFRVWGKSVSSSNKSKKTKTKKSGAKNLNSNVKYLLKTCPTLSKGDSHIKCVKSLQKFLQSKGFYKNYKIDGLYQVYTEKAVKGLQKQCKLKVTGKWDKATRSYFQKKYKYPTVPKDKKAIAISSSNIRL